MPTRQELIFCKLKEIFRVKLHFGVLWFRSGCWNQLFCTEYFKNGLTLLLTFTNIKSVSASLLIGRPGVFFLSYLEIAIHSCSFSFICYSSFVTERSKTCEHRDTA